MITRKKIFALLATTFAIGLMFVCSNIDDSDGTYGLNVSHLKPLAPTNVRATATSSSSITVTWSSAQGADGYRIYRSSSANGTYTQVATSDTTSYTDTGLSANTTYYYKVSAYNSVGESPLSSEASATTTTTPDENIATYYCPDECSEQTGTNMPTTCFATEEACLASIESGCTAGEDCDDDIGRCTVNGGNCTDNVERSNCEGTFEVGEICQTTTPTIETFTDPRDGQTYRIVTIGTQTWMAENLNYRNASWTHNDVSNSILADVTDKGSWCFDNNVINCETYGRLYTWEAAMEACPVGWRLPHYEEWQTLVNFAGSSVAGRMLKSRDGWANNGNGTDDYGFSALPGGVRYDYTGEDAFFASLDSSGYWWTATEATASYYIETGAAAFVSMRYNSASLGSISLGMRSTSYSVRCVLSGLSSAPRGVTATDNSSNSISISWSPVTGATGYYIYRSLYPDGTYTQIGSSTTTSFTDMGLSENTTYYYRVAAYNNEEVSPQSVLVLMAATRVEPNSQFNPNITYGTLIDTRDNKTYRTVIMPDGNEWMAENLNYDAAGSWCYGNTLGNCETYGRLYDWATAMAGSSSSHATPSGVQGVCPAGWHLPSRAEWNALVRVIESSIGESETLRTTVLRSQTGWREPWSDGSVGNGIDLYGFSALPAGTYGPSEGFSMIGFRTSWWASTEIAETVAYVMSTYVRTDSHSNGVGKVIGVSVRCVRTD